MYAKLTHSLWDSDMHIFAVSMKITVAISLDICNTTILTMGLDEKKLKRPQKTTGKIWTPTSKCVIFIKLRIGLRRGTF